MSDVVFLYSKLAYAGTEAESIESFLHKSVAWAQSHLHNSIFHFNKIFHCYCSPEGITHAHVCVCVCVCVGWLVERFACVGRPSERFALLQKWQSAMAATMLPVRSSVKPNAQIEMFVPIFYLDYTHCCSNLDEPVHVRDCTSHNLPLNHNLMRNECMNVQITIRNNGQPSQCWWALTTNTAHLIARWLSTLAFRFSSNYPRIALSNRHSLLEIISSHSSSIHSVVILIWVNRKIVQ